MKFNTSTLFDELIDYTKNHLNYLQEIDSLKLEQLQSRPRPNSWNALECVEHLNRYGDFYIPELKLRISNSKYAAKKYFKSGILGNYFAKSMLPSAKKIQTFKSMNPIGSNLDKEVISKCIMQQKEILSILNEARKVDLTKTKTAISISKIIKLRLGDTLRIVIYHNDRHFLQAKNAINNLSE